MKTAWLTLVVVGAFGSAASANAAHEVVLDAQRTAAVFEGVGASSAGASSRLLIDYPEPQRSEILDFLFKPKFGASLQHLKVEIGGDVNSTDGTEPSIARTREEFLNPKPEYFNRGYEWWLMKEAKKRNPQIIFDVLQWGAPGWIGDGKFYSQDNADFIAAFIKGAKKYHDLDISYCGVWNEKPYDTEWIKLLRRTLNANGLERVQIVAADEINKWTIADKMAKDPALRDAVQVIGTHYPHFQSTPIARSFGKPVWASEEGPWTGKWGVSGPGTAGLAQAYNRNYVVGRMTKTIIWSPVTSYYDILPFARFRPDVRQPTVVGPLRRSTGHLDHGAHHAVHRARLEVPCRRRVRFAARRRQPGRRHLARWERPQPGYRNLWGEGRAEAFAQACRPVVRKAPLVAQHGEGTACSTR